MLMWMDSMEQSVDLTIELYYLDAYLLNRTIIILLIMRIVMRIIIITTIIIILTTTTIIIIMVCIEVVHGLILLKFHRLSLTNYFVMCSNVQMHISHSLNL